MLNNTEPTGSTAAADQPRGAASGTASSRVRALAVCVLGLAVLGAWWLAGRNTALDWTYTLDGTGAMIESREPGGGVTRVQRDRIGPGGARRETTIRSDGSAIVLEHDQFSRRVKMTDPAGSTSYRYDGFGRVARVQRDGLPAVLYQYDERGQLASLAAGDQRVAYRYDVLGRVIGVDAPAGLIASHYQGGTARIIRAYPNGATSELEFSAGGDLQTVTHVDPASRVIARFQYGFRPDGLMATVNEYASGEDRSRAYEYDTAARLISAAVFARRTEYRYDRRGNLVEQTGVEGAARNEYDWADRLVSRNGERARHDASGNLTGYGSGSDARTFTFSAAGEVIEAASSRGVVKYRYDGDGALIARVVGGDMTAFVPDPFADDWRPLLAIDSRGQKTFYVWDADRVIAASTDGAVEYFLGDRLNSVRAVVNHRGDVVRLEDYGAFGAPARPLPAGGLIPAYAGMFFDPVSGLYLLRHRAFDPTLGRFLQRDPLQRVPTGSQKDLSSYAYCGNDPLNFADLTGAEPQKVKNTQTPNAVPVTQFNLPNFLDGLTLGLGSGVRSDAEILRETQGRFQIIDTTASGSHGGLADMATYVLTGGRGPLGNRNQINWTADQIVAHSAGNHIVGSGPNVIRVGASEQQGLSHSEIYRRDIISNLSTIELQVRHDYVGVGFTGKFDANPLVGVAEVAHDVGSFARGVASLAGKTLAWPVTGRGPFAEHDFVGYQNELAQAGQLKDAGTYNSHVQINRPDGTNHYAWDATRQRWQFLGSTSKPTAPQEAGPRRSGFDVSTSSAPLRAGPLDLDLGVPGRQPIGVGNDVRGPNAPAAGIPEPSKVGGIYLSGAQDALKQLGTLKGVAIDRTTRKLILVSSDSGRFDLPALRLEDVATIFRTVYQHGEAPWVTIDPKPSDPRGPTMIVRHGTIDADSYVAWVLFEADRLMKVYSLGQDNETRKAFRSEVAGYQSMLDLGDEAHSTSTWERFWIRPASVERRESRAKDLTMVDVPLMVDTERMVLRNGRLETAVGQQPSRPARAFSEWFTVQYASVAREAKSGPPADRHADAPVAVFQELRRIALLSAVAEAIRDQGVPFPRWMADVPVHHVAAILETPSTVATHQTGRVIRQIYGGATLSPADQDVRVVSDDKQAESLAVALHNALRGSAPLAPVKFQVGQDRFTAVALPGNETVDVGAAQVAETDLVVPLGTDASFALTRYFNSFIGSPWTLNLPVLEEQRRPTRRTRSSAEYRPAFSLTSPLGYPSAEFVATRFVPELQSELLAPAGSDEVLGLALGGATGVPGAKHRVLFRDGHELLFDESGQVVAWKRGPWVVLYRWKDGRLRVIEGVSADGARRSILLEYDAANRLTAARIDAGDSVAYSYDGMGRLTEVRGGRGVITAYRYNGAGLLSEILQNARSVRKFEYSAQGRLVREVAQDRTRAFHVEQSGERTVVKVQDSSSKGLLFSFDDALRPLHQELADGKVIDWTYKADGAMAAIVTPPGGWPQTITRSADGKIVTWKLPEGGEYRVAYNETDRTYNVAEGAGTGAIGARRVRYDGRPEWVSTGPVRAHSQYGPDNRLAGIVFDLVPTPRGAFHDWISVAYDDAGRMSVMRDSTGLDFRMTRDAAGLPVAWKVNTSEVRLSRDPRGTVTAVDTSWGERQEMAYEQSGLLRRATVGRDGKRTTADYQNGRLTGLQQFDGGRLSISYGPDAASPYPSRVVTPSGLELDYSYDDRGRVVEVNVDGVRRICYRYDWAGRITGLRETALTR